MITSEVNNIKASCKVKNSDVGAKLKEFSINSSLVTLKKSNFFVLRDKFVYIIFYTGHINITGIKAFHEINQSKGEIKAHLNLDIGEPRIDNITLSGSVKGKVNLFSFSSILQQNRLDFGFNPHKFPGLNFRPTSCPGTVVLFSSGKFILVGIKCQANITRVIDEFGRLFQTYELEQML